MIRQYETKVKIRHQKNNTKEMGSKICYRSALTDLKKCLVESTFEWVKKTKLRADLHVQKDQTVGSRAKDTVSSRSSDW